ncbi:hypothetical protein JZ751_016055 [Albula glossodonta]|uniref:Uncharacterized protein n=1 Tax=Albula glossodonta TaxID=121402 RepID=A0A8T2NYW8_9TELE|nr:hypothetical protein JZ751_016055 [Albula glossodonta]
MGQDKSRLPLPVTPADAEILRLQDDDGQLPGCGHVPPLLSHVTEVHLVHGNLHVPDGVVLGEAVKVIHGHDQSLSSQFSVWHLVVDHGVHLDVGVRGSAHVHGRELSCLDDPNDELEEGGNGRGTRETLFQLHARR